MYFLNAGEATERRAAVCGGLDRAVLNILAGMLHEQNNYVRALQPALAMATVCRTVASFCRPRTVRDPSTSGASIFRWVARWQF